MGHSIGLVCLISSQRLQMANLENLLDNTSSSVLSTIMFLKYPPASNRHSGTHIASLNIQVMYPLRVREHPFENPSYPVVTNIPLFVAWFFHCVITMSLMNSSMTSINDVSKIEGFGNTYRWSRSRHHSFCPSPRGIHQWCREDGPG